ncbi:hypothetical protein LZ31DRAFT_393246 [Colletotrichum somersetense]|nr:hypothetical protein LZ31DRAFT_393246 [Colletotrichum somersetense]
MGPQGYLVSTRINPSTTLPPFSFSFFFFFFFPLPQCQSAYYHASDHPCWKPSVKAGRSHFAVGVRETLQSVNLFTLADRIHPPHAAPPVDHTTVALQCAAAQL